MIGFSLINDEGSFKKHLKNYKIKGERK